mgnify:CR=1 FL=1
MWFELMRQAVTASSKQQVALDLGVSRTTISLIMNDKYPAKTDHIAQKVMEVYGRIACPHLSVDITQAQCTENRTRTAPTSSPREMKFWRACQTCKHNIQNETKRDTNPA